MLEKPNIPDDKIIACLRQNYNIVAASLEFLPLGNEANSWVYRVSADEGTSYFLKLRKGAVYEPSLTVPRFLNDAGIRQVVAALPTVNGELCASVEDFALILYPFIEGRTGRSAGLSDQQWVEFGAALRKIHTVQLPDALARTVQSETFVPKWSAMVRALQTRIDQNHFDDPFQNELAAFWRNKQAEINQIVDRTEVLGRALLAQTLPLALCHTDIHTDNVLVDLERRLFFVDWEYPLIAPIERDLMHVVGSVAVRSRHEECFFKGYGQIPINPTALAYYRYEWVVQEIGDYGERVLLAHDVGTETRQDAVQGFVALFQPGDVVEGAYQSEADLPPECR